MDNNFALIEQSLVDIRNRLLQDENLRKLLVYMSPDALKRVTPSIDDVLKENLISLYPVVEEGIITTNKEAVISLDLASLTFDDDGIRGSILVAITCTDSSLMLDDNKIRLLELARLVAIDLDGQKTAVSNKLEVVSYDRLINKHYYTGVITIAVTDDATKGSF